MEFRVHIADQALHEAEEAYLYIRREHPLNADRWFKQLFDLIETLHHMPAAFPKAPESKTLRRIIRQTFHGPYRILFRVDRRTVHILHIRHGARLRIGE